MKFEVYRSSDQYAGRQGPDVPQPLENAVFDAEENSWVVEVKDLDALMSLISATGQPIAVAHANRACGHLPFITILDVEQEDEEDEVPPPSSSRTRVN